MVRLIFASILAFFLLCSCVFAGSYVIELPAAPSAGLKALSENAVSGNALASLKPLGDTGFYMANLTDSEVQALRQEGYKVSPNFKVHAFLNVSVPHINAPQVWNISVNGTNLTGRGQTICVIDSGIDLNNSAFRGTWGNGSIIAGWLFYGGVNQECNRTNNSACLDYAGHGTEMAGVLVSQNLTYRGVAPDASLVIVKVINGTTPYDASGEMSDMVLGINYCTNHSSEYNISVISMSLGDEEFANNTYCDGVTDLSALRSSIDAAAAKNISVIVAAGNEDGVNGNITSVSAPACLSNATPVGAVNSSDGISSFSDYWAGQIVFAPGENIHTPFKGGVFSTDSGTSMSTPHVAGVLALMNQYLNLSGKKKTPQQLKSFSISTGLNVTSNHNNSRIDALALYHAFSDVLSVSIDSPTNNFIQNGSILTVSGTSGHANTTITVYNSTGNLTSENSTNQTTWSVNFNLSQGVYNITASVNNGTNSTNTTVYNITIDQTPPGISISSPTSNTNASSNQIIVNFTVSDTNLNYSNISIVNSVGTIVNSTISSASGNVSVNLSVSTDGAYNITAVAYDLAGNSNNSVVSNITVFGGPILKIRPEWTSTYLQGNFTLCASVNQTLNSSRLLYYNINQTKTLQFYLNNSGDGELSNVTAVLSGLLGLNSTLSWADGSDINLSRNISANSSSALNLTIYSPNSTGNFTGYIWINSSNGVPYSDLNLTLNLSVTNLTLTRLSSTNSSYLIDTNNSTQVGFFVYFYDNQTPDLFWPGNYSANISNSTFNQNLSLNLSGGLFYSSLNAVNLSEGNYTMSGNFSDAYGNIVNFSQNLTLIRDIYMNATILQNESLIVKDANYTLRVNISKSGLIPFGNGAICVSIPSQIANRSSLCQNLTNLSANFSRNFDWNLSGSITGTYNLNITAYSLDGKINKTIQKSVSVKYGELDSSMLSTYPPNNMGTSETFYVKVRVTNNGDLTASNIVLNISYSPTYFELISGVTSYAMGDLAPDSVGDYTWTMKSKTYEGGHLRINVTISATNATLISDMVYRSIDIVDEAAYDATTGSSGGGSVSGDTSSQNTSLGTLNLTFTKPSELLIELFQGDNLTVPLMVYNTGNQTIGNIYFDIAGLDQLYYRLNLNEKSSIAKDYSKSSSLVFSIPAQAEAKDYPITIKAVSDQATWTKSLTLRVKPSKIEVSGLEGLSITQGENKSASFSVRNTGVRNFTGVSLSIGGLPSGTYSISPQTFENIAGGSENTCILSFSIPYNDPIGQKMVNVTVITNQGIYVYSFMFNILPSQEEKSNIEAMFQSLSSEVFQVSTKLSKADPSKVNVTAAQGQMSEVEEKLRQVNESLKNGDYSAAKKILGEVQSSMMSLEDSLIEVKETSGPGSIFMMAVFIFVAVLLGVAGFYKFAPRKGVMPKGGYIIAPPSSPNSVKSSGGIVSSIAGKISGKSSEEAQREKMIEEWRKRYEIENKDLNDRK